MKNKIILGIFALSVLLVFASILNSCSDSNADKTATADQGVAVKDSSEKMVFEHSQPASVVDTPSAEASVPEKEKMAENSSVKSEPQPSANKASATNNEPTSPAANKANPKPTINETPETKTPNTTAETPKSDPVSPAKEVVKKEEPKVITPPEPKPETKPEPVIKKPEAPIVVKPVVKDTQPPKVEPKVPETAKDNWVVPAKENNKVNPYKDDVASLGTGKSLYKKHCASCHGKKGLGDGSKAKQLDTPSGDFTLPSFQKQTDGSLFYKTREGKGDMPGYKKKMPDDEDIWLIVNYIRTLK